MEHGTAAASDRDRKPFLKWTGGKQWLSRRLASALSWDSKLGTYHEPFLGGGSLFFALQPSRAILSDLNSDLIATYIAVRDSVERVIEALEVLPNDLATFEAVRGSAPGDRVSRSARLLYLNRTAFNGIYRVNRNGQFNVPFGYYQNRVICHPERLRECSRALKTATLRTAHFSDASRQVSASDFVYFDPPYVTGHNNNGFIKYNRRLFDWRAQEELAAEAHRLRELGAQVVVSNAAHDKVLELYEGFNVIIMSRKSLIGGGIRYRGIVQEAVISSHSLDLGSLTDG